MNSSLVQEYLKIMDIIIHYDELIVLIKCAAITFGIAIIGLYFQNGNRNLLVLCLLSSIAFSFMDAKYKQYQTNYYPRMQEIEECSAKEISGKECVPLQVDRSWNKNHNWYGVLQQYTKFNIYFPHGFLVLLSLFMYIRTGRALSKQQGKKS